MRLPALLLLLAGCICSQFRSTVPLVVAPTTVKDSKGNFVDVDESDLILYDNNVARPIQSDLTVYPISPGWTLEVSRHSATTLARYTNAKAKTVSETDKTAVPVDVPPMDLIAPFTSLAHLASPNVAHLFSSLTGATTSNFH